MDENDNNPNIVVFIHFRLAGKPKSNKARTAQVGACCKKTLEKILEIISVIIFRDSLRMPIGSANCRKTVSSNAFQFPYLTFGRNLNYQKKGLTISPVVGDARF